MRTITTKRRPTESCQGGSARRSATIRPSVPSSRMRRDSPAWSRRMSRCRRIRPSHGNSAKVSGSADGVSRSKPAIPTMPTTACATSPHPPARRRLILFPLTSGVLSLSVSAAHCSDDIIDGDPSCDPGSFGGRKRCPRRHADFTPTSRGRLRIHQQLHYCRAAFRLCTRFPKGGSQGCPVL